MRPSQLLATAAAMLMPVTSVLASASPEADAGAYASVKLDDLVERQLDLGNIGEQLSDLVELLGSITDLLNPGFFEDVQTTVTGLGDLLAEPFPSQTRSIISEAGGLLESLSPVLDIITEIDIGGVVDSVSGLLTPGTINMLSGLLSKANSLLTTEFIDQTKGLIADVAPVSRQEHEIARILIIAPSSCLQSLSSSLPLSLLFSVDSLRSIGTP